MNLPDDLLYTREHEWLLVEGETGTLGITEYAQNELGDVVYVELPDIGETFHTSDAFGSVESVKAVSELYTPVSGQVIEINESLAENPELVNEDPYGEGWMVRIQIENSDDLDELLSPNDYREFLDQESS